MKIYADHDKNGDIEDSEELFENILLDYVIYDHDRFTMNFGLYDTDATCTTLHLSLDIVSVYTILRS